VTSKELPYNIVKRVIKILLWLNGDTLAGVLVHNITKMSFKRVLFMLYKRQQQYYAVHSVGFILYLYTRYKHSCQFIVTIPVRNPWWKRFF